MDVRTKWPYPRPGASHHGGHRQDLIARLKAAKKRPAPKAAAEPAAKRGAMICHDKAIIKRCRMCKYQRPSSVGLRRKDASKLRLMTNDLRSI